jgi:pimeloyl-ACP methyl ester carboxylesterase
MNTLTMLIPAAAFAVTVGAMIAFGTRKDPMAMSAAQSSFSALGEMTFPPLQNVIARDDTPLAYRAYLVNDAKNIAILVHGSASDGRAMHCVAESLCQRGICAYAIDVRGHGSSGRHGDIDYIGQLEDDLADVIQELTRRHAAARVTVVGHSMGGGLALRFAGSRYGKMVDCYVVAAPFIHHSVSVTRKDAGGWAAPYLPRIIGLTILQYVGIRAFQHLTCIAFALPELGVGLVSKYSFRLLNNFRPHINWKGDIKKIDRPVSVIVGAKDEMFVAEEYAPLLEPLNLQIHTQVLPGLGHFGMYVDKTATEAIGNAILTVT